MHANNYKHFKIWFGFWFSVFPNEKLIQTENQNKEVNPNQTKIET